MKKISSLYTEKEEILLSKISSFKTLKVYTFVMLILVLFISYITIFDIIKLINIHSLHYKTEFTITYLFLITIDAIICFFTFKRFFEYRNLLIKYKKINSENENPLAILFKTRLEECNKLLDSGCNYYTAQKEYMKIKQFLETYEKVLPEKTYKDGLEELKTIEFKMLSCDIQK